MLKYCTTDVKKQSMWIEKNLGKDYVNNCVGHFVLLNRRYQIYCARRVSGITFIRYALNRKNGKTNNLNILEQ